MMYTANGMRLSVQDLLQLEVSILYSYTCPPTQLLCLLCSWAVEVPGTVSCLLSVTAI